MTLADEQKKRPEWVVIYTSGENDVYQIRQSWYPYPLTVRLLRVYDRSSALAPPTCSFQLWDGDQWHEVLRTRETALVHDDEMAVNQILFPGQSFHEWLTDLDSKP